MQFLYLEDAKEQNLKLSTREYSHILRVRRAKVGDILKSRNLKDDNIYYYKIDSIDRKYATLTLLDTVKSIIKPKKYLHLSWCVVDPKIIEKTLPFLNEFGVSKISFVYCEFSQKNYKIDLQRLKRILVNSSQQCGRSKLMEIEVLTSIKELLKKYPEVKIIDFESKKLDCHSDFSSLLIGCEGGFSKTERDMFNQKSIYGLNFDTILRSESAVLYVTSLILS